MALAWPQASALGDIQGPEGVMKKAVEDAQA